MQSAKGQNKYKFDQFQVTIQPFSNKKLGITIVDTFSRTQFKEQNLELKTIATSTLIKALQKSISEIKMAIQVKKTDSNTILRIDVLVSSQFLKPVQQTIFINKSKQISQSELLKQSIDRLTQKISEMKLNDNGESRMVLCSDKYLPQREYSSGGYETIGSVKLTKGKYMITVSFLVKAHSTWMYIYHGNGSQFMIHGGFYVPNGTSFIPIVLHKYYQAKNDQQFVVTTNYASSYRIALKNTIVSAHELQDSK